MDQLSAGGFAWRQLPSRFFDLSLLLSLATVKIECLYAPIAPLLLGCNFTDMSSHCLSSIAAASKRGNLPSQVYFLLLEDSASWSPLSVLYFATCPHLNIHGLVILAYLIEVPTLYIFFSYLRVHISKIFHC